MKIFDGVEIQPTMSPIFTNTLSVMSLVARVVLEARKCRDERLAFAANGGPKTPLEAVIAQAGASIPTLEEALSKIVGMSEGDPKGAEIEQITAMLMNSPDLAGVLMALLQSGVNGPQKAGEGGTESASAATGPTSASPPSATATPPNAPAGHQPGQPQSQPQLLPQMQPQPQPPSGSWLPPQAQHPPAPREHIPPASASAMPSPGPWTTGRSPAYAPGGSPPMSAPPRHSAAQPGHPVGAQAYRPHSFASASRSATGWQSPRPPASGMTRWEALSIKLGLPGPPADARSVPDRHRAPPRPSPRSAAQVQEDSEQAGPPPSPTGSTPTPDSASTSTSAPTPASAPKIPSEHTQPRTATNEPSTSPPLVDMRAVRIVEGVCADIRSSVESWKTAIDAQMSTAEQEMDELRTAVAELIKDDEPAAADHSQTAQCNQLLLFEETRTAQPDLSDLPDLSRLPGQSLQPEQPRPRLDIHHQPTGAIHNHPAQAEQSRHSEPSPQPDQSDQSDQSSQAEELDQPLSLEPTQGSEHEHDPKPEPESPEMTEPEPESPEMTEPEPESLEMAEQPKEGLALHDQPVGPEQPKQPDLSAPTWSTARPDHLDENPAPHDEPDPPRLDQIVLTDEANAYVHAHPERFNLRPMELDDLVNLAARAMSLTDDRGNLAETIRKLQEQSSSPPVMRHPMCTPRSPSVVAHTIGGRYE